MEAVRSLVVQALGVPSDATSAAIRTASAPSVGAGARWPPLGSGAPQARSSSCSPSPDRGSANRGALNPEPCRWSDPGPSMGHLASSSSAAAAEPTSMGVGASAGATGAGGHCGGADVVSPRLVTEPDELEVSFAGDGAVGSPAQGSPPHATARGVVVCRSSPASSPSRGFGGFGAGDRSFSHGLSGRGLVVASAPSHQDHS